MHLDEEQVQRLLHGELLPPAEHAARAHLNACAECRAQVADAHLEEREFHSLLRNLDHPVPRVDAGTVMRRARAYEPRWGRWAAGIALALGLGGASYAIPGSPLPVWIEAAVHWVGGDADPTPAPSPTSDSKSGPKSDPKRNPSVAGIALAPGQNFVIEFTSPHGQARVTLAGGSDVVVHAPAGSVTFTSHTDRLLIDNLDPTATIDIEIPRAAPRVEMRLGSRRIFLKEGPRVTAEEATASLDLYLLQLAPRD